MNDKPLIAASPNSRQVSLREQSSSTIQTAIRSPHDEGKTLERVNVVLGLYFDPDQDPTTRAAVRAEFVRALREFPDWAVQRGFDAWVKTMSRRPSPGEIAILAQRQLQPLIDELGYRKRMQEAQDERQASGPVVDASTASEILAKAGFTPRRMEAILSRPMPSSLDEADAEPAAKRPHWSETADPDGAAMQQLRAIRDGNPLVQAARFAAEKNRPPQDGAV